MSFTTRDLSVTFQLANGVFISGSNTASVSGLRVECEISATAGPYISQAEITIYGMSLTTMNQLSTMGSQWNQRGQNSITIFASDGSGGNTLIFQGIIFNAFVDGSGQPDVCFRVVASPGVYQSVNQMTPISYQGTTDATTILQRLAQQMGFQFENNGVSVQLSNPYYDSSPWQAAIEIADHANIDLTVDRGTMVITPRGQPRTGSPFMLSPDTGMIGYPAFIQNGVVVQALFDPQAKQLGIVNIQSALSPANGPWLIRKIDYSLQSQLPKGKWQMTLETVSLGS